MCFKPEAPGLGSTIVPVPVGCHLLRALEDHSLLPDGLALARVMDPTLYRRCHEVERRFRRLRDADVSTPVTTSWT